MSGVSAGITFQMDEQKKVDILVGAAKTNSTANFTVNLWHHIRLLKGVIPTPLQVTNTFTPCQFKIRVRIIINPLIMYITYNVSCAIEPHSTLLCICSSSHCDDAILFIMPLLQFSKTVPN